MAEIMTKTLPVRFHIDFLRILVDSGEHTSFVAHSYYYMIRMQKRIVQFHCSNSATHFLIATIKDLPAVILWQLVRCQLVPDDGR